MKKNNHEKNTAGKADSKKGRKRERKDRINRKSHTLTNPGFDRMNIAAHDAAHLTDGLEYQVGFHG
jgi:hypothetical protein